MKLSLVEMVERAWRVLRRGVGAILLSAAIAAPLRAAVSTLPQQPKPALPALEELLPQPAPPANMPIFTIQTGSGNVPIYMLHKITDDNQKEDRYTIRERELRGGLERLYNGGYSLVSLKSYLNGTIEQELPPGRKAVVLTDDDADRSVIAVERDAHGKVVYDDEGKPKLRGGTLYDLLNRFADEHPGFGRALTIYVDFNSKERLPAGLGTPFDDAEMGGYLLKLLAEDPNVTIGNHSVSHKSRKSMTPEQLRNDCQLWDATFTKLTGLDARRYVRTTAHPFGEAARSRTSMSVLKERFDAICDAWGGAAPDPHGAEAGWRRTSIPRIEFQPKARFDQPDTVAMYGERNRYAFAVRGGEQPAPPLVAAHAKENGRGNPSLTESAGQPQDPAILLLGAGGAAALLYQLHRGFPILSSSPAGGLPDELRCYVTHLYAHSTTTLSRIAHEAHAIFGARLSQAEVSAIGRSGETRGLLRRSINDLVEAEHAVLVYNRSVQAYVAGDRKALCHLHRRNAAALGIPEEQYRGALTRHVTDTCAGRGNGLLLRRFDRTLLPDEESYTSKVADAYVNSSATLQEIASQQSAKYGMRVSASTVSRLARERLNRQPGAAPVASRREARAVCASRRNLLRESTTRRRSESAAGSPVYVAAV
jgi:hypothetical protein